MYQRISSIADKTFPITHETKLYLLISKGFVVVLFLTLYGPFSLSNLNLSERFFLCTGYGLIASLGLAIDFFVLPRFFSAFQTDIWTIKRQGLQFVFALIFDSIASTVYTYNASNSVTIFYNHTHTPISLSIHSFLFFLTAITLSTPLIIFLSLGIFYVIYLNRSLQVASPVPIEASEQGKERIVPYIAYENKLVLFSENGKDLLRICPKQLAYIASEDNYCTIVYWEDLCLKTHLVRSSLKRLEDQLLCPLIVRCHRSYIVNMDQVSQVEGNTHGYKLYLPGICTPIPVSKSYSTQVLAQLQQP